MIDPPNNRSNDRYRKGPNDRLRNERKTEPSQRFITIEPWQKEEFMAALASTMHHWGLELDRHIIIGDAPIKEAKDGSEGEKEFIKITFTAQCGDKRAGVVEIHDVLDTYDSRPRGFDPLST